MNAKVSKITIALLITFFSLSTTACAQRMPKAKTAQNTLKSYFKGYGGDYKETEFGQYPIDEIEVSSITELQHGVVWVEAFVSLDEGNIVYKVGVALEKKTIRWKVLSWENLGRAS